MNKELFVFVDVDGTLIDKDDNPRPHINEFFQQIALVSHIVVWSAGLTGDRHYEMGEYAKRKIASLDFKLETNVQSLIDHYLWKGNKVVLDAPQFYIDDETGLLEVKKEKGYGTFRVPFYEESTDPDKTDRWLLNAAQAVEQYALSLVL